MDPSMRERVREAWNEAWWALGVAGEARSFDALMLRYDEPHRAYHTIEHLDSALRDLEPARGEAPRIGEVLLALLFHDAVYDPTRSDNEARSAALAVEALARHGIEQPVVDRVAHMIEATRDHASSDPGGTLLIDADLAILGAEPAVFDRFEAGIRREYAFVPDAAYRAGRSAVLRGFLERPVIFQTRSFLDRFEVMARRNLARALDTLGR